MHAGHGNALAWRHALHARAQGFDQADGFAAANGRQSRLVAVLAAHRPQVVVVNGRQQGLDPHFARAGLRHRLLAQLKNVGGFAKNGVDGTAHGSSLKTQWR
ncbi:hypothetical protein D3C78_1082470 [compost metagenome]